MGFRKSSCPGNPQLDPLSSSAASGLVGGLGGLSHAVHGSRSSFKVVTMETSGGSRLLLLLSLSCIAPDLHSLS